MQRRRLWFGGLLVFLIAAAGAAQLPATTDLVVHEWGTFLAMAGSDGVALDGMYHEEHALPAFVHARSRDQLRLRSAILKGETPVIYFYTTRPQKVRVSVRFPHGLWTQWYPQANIAGPQFTQTGTPLQPTNGRLVWCADVLPASAAKSPPPLPATSADALWNFARDVDAAYVCGSDTTTAPEQREYERFLFYRGLGQAPMPLGMTATEGGTLSWRPDSALGGKHLFVLRVEDGKGAFRYLPALRPGERITGAIPSLDGALPLPEFARNVADELASRLTECGLYAKEARAMVNTWRTSYFTSPGIRVLCVLPRRWTDEFIPLDVQPRPRQIVRVMVGRLELLTPQRERLAAAAVADLASPDSVEREHAFAYLRDQGRYVEPILRQVLRTSRDEAVKTRCRRLLMTDFVTELRAALHAAADGKRLADEPRHARAQLACLLREIGLAAEAKTEAEPIAAALRGEKAPALSDPESRRYLRTYARAMEAMGNDAEAEAKYAELIRFGSQIGREQRCLGCHDGTAAPRDITWFRDWWAGPKYAQSVARVGSLDTAIAKQQALLRDKPDDTATRLMLAYLYEQKQDPARAAALWTQLAAPRRLARK